MTRFKESIFKFHFHFLVVRILQPVALQMNVTLTNQTRSGEVFTSKDSMLSIVKQATDYYLGGLDFTLNFLFFSSLFIFAFGFFLPQKFLAYFSILQVLFIHSFFFIRTIL